MTLPVNIRMSRLLLTLAMFLVCGLAVTPEAAAQKPPKQTGTKDQTKSESVRKERRKQKRQSAPIASITPSSEESNKFFDLGERFREQQKRNAAEAAYKEAIKIWPGNDEALLELGYLYLTVGKISDAQQVSSRLRSVNGAYASELLADISVRKSTIDH